MRILLRLSARFLLSLLAASVLIFLLLRIVPGDPARIALGVTATDAAVAELSARLGTDRPLPVQYLDWLGGLLTGDFGLSLSSRQDITPLVLDRAQVSLILTGSAMVLSLLIAVPLGVWSARRARHPDGQVISALSQIGIAVPSFLAGVLLVAVVSIRFGWLPANGWVPPGVDFGAFLSRLILPVIALTLVQASILTRYVRSSVLEVLGADYLRTARAIGQSRSRALRRHGLRNAALPVLTVIGVQLSSLIVGAVVIEQVFVLPGLGSMLLDAVANRDLTTVQTIVMLLVVFTLAVTMVVDLLYRLIDPRLRGRATA
ncbi:ABC transporter permease [Corynebacterium guangdongense]|uniref:Peptide/nickel transport system permease protein n=1 Tax=Corynebacterium guangdongense TaxID=1783348 RepID=A0ABU1ZYK1_9CORY|nr:ABC transporter permease [Corynebacterium guangdongense]MDR7330004.1 peptide/nickel transport system permease protein [Corynebacterium guangdongense]WJZ18562.1 Glutathione transport system permease protein GsiC [Corynebacterium guangdongense]